MTFPVDHLLVGMDFTARQSRHAVIDAARQLSYFRMQRAAESNVHFLEAAADAEQRHAAIDTHLDQFERQRVPPSVVGFSNLDALRRQNASDGHWRGRRSQHAVDRVQQNVDVREGGIAGEYQRQRATDVGRRREVSLSDPLRGKSIFGKVRAPNYTDHGHFSSQISSQFNPARLQRPGRQA